jgi:hypothetical protein
MTVHIESRTLDGRVWLAADDVAEALRTRAAEFTDQAEALGDPVPGEEWDLAVVLHATASELHQRADALDCAVIEHISD